jgi:hypothetical protein
MLRVSPMRADGSLVNPDGTPLFPATDARIASNGTSFMLAYRDATGTHVVPLDENGSPHGPNTLIPDYTFDFDIISNGHTFFFVTSTGTAVEALVFAPDGSPYALKKLDTGTYSTFAAAVIGDVYAIAYHLTPCGSCSSEIHLALLAEDAATTDAVLVDGASSISVITMAAADDRLLIGLIGDGAVRTMIAGRDGKVIAPLKTIASTGNVFVDAHRTAFWDGASFLVTFPTTGGNLAAVRVSPANDLLDPSPAVIATRSPTTLTFTRTSQGIVALWVSRTDVMRRTFASNAELVTTPATETAEVLSLRAQSEASLEQNGNEPLRVWREGSRDVHVMLSIAGKIVDVASATDRDLRDPAVVRGGDVILVFWRDVPRAEPFAFGSSGYRTYARRFALDGTPLDAQPLLVATNDTNLTGTESGSAATFDGRNFVVFWSNGVAIQGARISPSGTLVGTTPFTITGPADRAESGGMRAVRAGNEVLIAWSSWTDWSSSLISPRPPSLTSAEIARLETRGSEMQVLDARAVWQDSGVSKQVDLVWNGTNALLVSRRHGCVDATLLDANLATLKDVTGIDCSTALPNANDLAAAWNGSEYVLLWSAVDSVRATRFDASLKALDAEPFNVAPPGLAAFEPAVAAAASGVEVTYVRLDQDIPRLFSRTLDRAGLTTRGRVIGH